MYRERILIKVATKEGHAAFWHDELAHLGDQADGTQIVLTPLANDAHLGQRGIVSTWSTERILKAIEEATGPANTSVRYVHQDKDGRWRDINTGVLVKL